jgi:GT2 family glycosyltransferase
MNSNTPKVSVIILNWNGWKDTIECLESLYQIDYPNYDIILVDNHSQDDSIQRIRDYCNGKIEPKSTFYNYNKENKPIQIFEYTQKETESDMQTNKSEGYQNLSSDKKLILIKNDKNYGFAEGNNVGIRYSIKTLNPKYILLLNNDTVVEKHFLTEMVKTGEDNNKTAVIGSKTYYYNFNDKNDVLWSVGGIVDLSRYPGYHDIDLNDKKQPTIKNSKLEVDWISGAVMLIKTDMMPKNLLNSDFFFGCEDVDLCIEMKNKGFKMVTNLKAVVWHKAGASKSKVKFRGISKEIKTNLKFMKAHEKNYKLYLPIYMLQVIYRYSSMFIKKLARDTKNSVT